MQAVLACALALAAGCGKEPSKDLPPAAPPAPEAPTAPARGSAPSDARASSAIAPPEERCRPAVDHALAASGLPSHLVERLAPIMAEACRSDGWSAQLLACMERAKDVTSLEACKPTDAQQASLRARLAHVVDVDGSLATAGVVIGATPESASSDALEVRLHGYANLLAIDVSIFQSIEAYPEVPKGTTFEADGYTWRRPAWLPLGAAEKQVAAILASTSGTPSNSADAAVHAYAEKLASWLPRLISLATYIDGKKFVDDEFDRGRKEAGDFQRTAAELTRLRAPMRGAVFAAWRDLVAGYRDSPRAVAAYAWLACMSLADRVMEHAKPEAVSKAVSECRRSIPRVAQLRTAAGFDADLRTAAIELGDWVAQGYPSWRTSVSDALGRLTLRYLELWPKLPTTPAEKPAP